MSNKCDFKIIWNANIGSKWQIVIPKEARENLNIKPWESLIVVTKDSKAIILVKADSLQEFIDYVQNNLKN